MLALLLSLWFFRTAVALLESTSYWQLKEYRWDRMKEFFFHQHGYAHFFTIYHGFYLLSAVIGLILYVTSLQPEWFAYPIGVLFLAESLHAFHQAFLRRLRRPKPTIKALLIWLLPLGLQIFLVALAYWYSSEVSFFVVAVGLAFLSVVEHDVQTAVIFLLNALGQPIKRRYFVKAQAKRLKRKDLIVIGITGSYGKSSVKEFLAHILSAKFRVLKTEKNTNTEMGIAQTILKKLEPEHQIFVCEMGAYRKGEIAVCAQIARPQYGIFTGLNEQHVALFGSLDKTFQAKWELISSLPADGLAVFNGDSPELRDRLKPTECPSLVCSLEDGDVMAEHVEVFSDHLRFHYRDQVLSVPLLGRFQILNVLMAITIAEKLGMSLREIAEQVKSLLPPDKTMCLREFSKGFIVDDSYNVNTDGLRAALEHLQHFPDHEKVIVFPGILELGDQTDATHHQLGKSIAQSVDFAFFTDPNFSLFLSQGAFQFGLARERVFLPDGQEDLEIALLALFERHPEKKWVLLFESRGAEKVMKKLEVGA